MQNNANDDSFLIILFSDPEKDREKKLFRYIKEEKKEFLITDLKNCWTENGPKDEYKPFDFILINQFTIYHIKENPDGWDKITGYMERSCKKNIGIFSHITDGIPESVLFKRIDENKKTKNSYRIHPPVTFSHSEGYPCWEHNKTEGLSFFLELLNKVVSGDGDFYQPLSKQFIFLKSFFLNKQKWAFEHRHFILSMLMVKYLEQQLDEKSISLDDEIDSEKIKLCSLFPDEKKKIVEFTKDCLNKKEGKISHAPICKFASFLEELIRKSID